MNWELDAGSSLLEWEEVKNNNNFIVFCSHVPFTSFVSCVGAACVRLGTRGTTRPKKCSVKSLNATRNMMTDYLNMIGRLSNEIKKGRDGKRVENKKVWPLLE